jgi:hypothetical protein
VTFNDVSAGWNGQYGAKVVTTGAFTIAATDWNNWYSKNILDGLNLHVSGKITLNKVQTYDNGARDEFGTPIGTPAYGIYILGSGNALGTSPIVIMNIEMLGNTLDGLYLETTSAITGTNLTANNNADYGIRLNQTTGPLVTPAVTLTNIKTNFNGETGLQVEARGNITLNKLDASNNGGTAGVNLTNNLGKGTITVNNTGSWAGANFNTGVGLKIVSSGVVTVSGLYTLGNSLEGIVIDNHSALLPSAVTVNSCTMRENGTDAILGGNGLNIWTTGIATINGSWSIGNHGDGISLNTTNNAFINSTGSIMNDRSGIYVIMDPLKILKLTNSTWFGNVRNPGSSDDKNLRVPGGVLGINVLIF